ncbi:MAG: DUF1592 domain-containing protein [Verrucomicrobiota bacterium]
MRALITSSCASLLSFTAAEAAQIEPLTKAVPSFVETYCLDCHDELTEKGDHNFEPFLNDPLAAENHIDLIEILDQLNLGEMPPNKKGVDQPKSQERRAVIAELTRYLSALEASKTPKGAVLRRLSRHEYNNTMRDLLHIHPDASDPTRHFPPDQQRHGFTTIGESQALSDHQLSLYMEAARFYLDQALVLGQSKPNLQHWTFTPEDFTHSKSNDTAVFHRVIDKHKRWVDIGHGEPVDRYPTYPKDFADEGIPVSGLYRIRVKAAGVGRENPYDPTLFRCDLSRPLKLGLWHVPNKSLLSKSANEGRVFVRAFDLPDNDPEIFESFAWMPAGSTPYVHWINGEGPSKPLLTRVRDRYHPETQRWSETRVDQAREQGLPFPPRSEWEPKYPLSEVYEGPRVRVFEMTLEGPMDQQWPPAGHQRLFGDITDARQIDIPSSFQRFASRAFRRPVSHGEIAHHTDLVENLIANGTEHEEAIKLGLAAILTSPRFLYLDEGNPETGENLDDFELASRLSYMLWSSTPDQRLRDLAREGRLSNPSVLSEETERLLNDPRASAFAKYFSNAWLRLDKIGTMPPSTQQYRAYYYDRLESAMKKESHLFFASVLRNNRPVTDFLVGPYTFANDMLAKHYGLEIDGIGEEFQRVRLPVSHRRRGVIGHASVLTASANGVETSPVVRGIWLLESILGTPPPPPPPDVPPIEPDTRGATTIREQLVKHRSVEACADCHAKIDPWGFALEFYDPIGGLRTHYPYVAPDGRIVTSRDGRPVDGTAELPSGEFIENESDLKSLLVDRKDQFTKNLIQKLLIHATGREPTYRDQPEIDRIANQYSKNDHGLRDLVHLVISSDAFARR